MITFLQQPFPYSENFSKRFLTVTGISLFVFFFLAFFKPFGMSNIGDQQIFVAAGYGGVTFIIASITNIVIPKLFPRIFNEAKWTLLHEIIYIQFMIFLVATGNLLLTVWLGYERMSWKGLLNFELITLAVASFPVCVLIITKQNILLRRNLSAAKNMTENLYHKERLQSKEGELVTIFAENEKDNLTVEARSICYVTAADNYVDVFYSNGEGIEKKIIRTTLRNVQGNLKLFSQFYRCHRTYIVNLEKVVKVAGNAQGYRLILENIAEQVPVARSMNQEINLRLVR